MPRTFVKLSAIYTYEVVFSHRCFSHSPVLRFISIEFQLKMKIEIEKFKKIWNCKILKIVLKKFQKLKLSIENEMYISSLDETF